MDINDDRKLLGISTRNNFKNSYNKNTPNLTYKVYSNE